MESELKKLRDEQLQDRLLGNFSNIQVHDFNDGNSLTNHGNATRQQRIVDEDEDSLVQHVDNTMTVYNSNNTNGGGGVGGIYISESRMNPELKMEMVNNNKKLSPFIPQ
jgi:hypothetical protein